MVSVNCQAFWLSMMVIVISVDVYMSVASICWDIVVLFMVRVFIFSSTARSAKELL